VGSIDRNIIEDSRLSVQWASLTEIDHAYSLKSHRFEG
jgi:hypothetical protein